MPYGGPRGGGQFLMSEVPPVLPEVGGKPKTPNCVTPLLGVVGEAGARLDSVVSCIHGKPLNGTARSWWLCSTRLGRALGSTTQRGSTSSSGRCCGRPPRFKCTHALLLEVLSEASARLDNIGALPVCIVATLVSITSFCSVKGYLVHKKTPPRRAKHATRAER